MIGSGGNVGGAVGGLIWTGGKVPGGEGGDTGGPTKADIKSRPFRASRVKRVLPLRREEPVQDVVRANGPLIELKFNIVRPPLNEFLIVRHLFFRTPAGLLV
jgi:hypothetical protein